MPARQVQLGAEHGAALVEAMVHARSRTSVRFLIAGWLRCSRWFISKKIAQLPLWTAFHDPRAQPVHAAHAADMRSVVSRLPRTEQLLQLAGWGRLKGLGLPGEAVSQGICQACQCHRLR